MENRKVNLGYLGPKATELLNEAIKAELIKEEYTSKENTQSSLESPENGQGVDSSTQDQPISWKDQQKAARDMIFNVNLTNLTFAQLAILQSIEDEEEFFNTFGNFVIQKQ